MRSVQNLSKQYGKKFRLGISISGISLKLLAEYVPQVIEMMKNLSDKGCIDFFAVPYSHSILPFYDRKELVSQTDAHKEIVQQLFQREPLAFVAHSPVQSDSFLNFVTDTGFNSVFTYSNHDPANTRHLGPIGIENHPKAVFYINHVLSEKYQELAVTCDNPGAAKALIPFVRYTRKHASLVKPLVLFFNPLQNDIIDFKRWELLTSSLLERTGGAFYSLSDLADISNYFAVENNFSKEMLSQFKLPNYWMKNNMQKEAFKQFQVIYELVRQGEHPYLTEAWNFLQDINNFFYMSDSFFIEGFARKHYNPFRSPHEAFTNYMNAASRFWHMDTIHRKQLFANNSYLFASSN